MRIHRYLWYLLRSVTIVVACLVVAVLVFTGMARFHVRLPNWAGLVGSAVAVALVAWIVSALFGRVVEPRCPRCGGRLRETNWRSLTFKCTACAWTNEG
jgi:hypothetical protein